MKEGKEVSRPLSTVSTFLLACMRVRTGADDLAATALGLRVCFLHTVCPLKILWVQMVPPTFPIPTSLHARAFLTGALVSRAAGT